VRLSRQTNISVRTLVYCAVNEPNLSRVPEIAKAFGVTDMFLFKIILPVAKNGLLETIRGRKGGIRLARPADQILLADVLRLARKRHPAPGRAATYRNPTQDSGAHTRMHTT